MKTNTKVPKTPFFAAFSVGAVLFSAHAGGGFATGNQANTYYVGLGWTGIISAIAAMLLLTLTMREAMIMYNSRGLTSYKQLFETLYHPFDKIEWAFEVFFYIMVLMAVAAAISGAASALNNYFTINYYIGVAIVGVIVLMLTIFGATILRYGRSRNIKVFAVFSLCPNNHSALVKLFKLSLVPIWHPQNTHLAGFCTISNAIKADLTMVIKHFHKNS